MKLKMIALAGAVALCCGVGGVTFADGLNIQIGGSPAPTIVEAPPTYVEEGATVNGVVVAEPPDADYVLINGQYYYWQPSLNVWVHSHHAGDWHPRAGAHVYNHWSDHPMYKGHH